MVAAQVIKFKGAIVPKLYVRLNRSEYRPIPILRKFKLAAEVAGWTPDKIRAIIKEATQGDYRHCLATLSEHCSF
jgi:hypothetical protein